MEIAFKFDKKTTNALQKIFDAAFLSNTDIYFVGGMVRDAFMNKGIKDIDILIEGSAIDFVNKIRDINIKSIHKDFNTVKTIMDDIEIDFASTREEFYPHSGCLPVVTKTGIPINEDLKRRDFTINAIASKIILEKGKINYQIIDPFNGVSDIKKKTLKILHNKSFVDDPTRILRGVDFKFRFNFDFDKETKTLMEQYINKPDREHLSIDRIRLTAKKIFSSSKTADKTYKYILDNKLYRIWMNTTQVNTKLIPKIKEARKIFRIEDGEDSARLYCETFKFSEYMYPPYCKLSSTDYEIYDFFKNYDNVELALYYIKNNDKKAKHYFGKLKNTKLLIKGSDIMNFGIKEGKDIGKILHRALVEKINNPKKYKRKEDEIKLAKSLFNSLYDNTF